jgi:hypothetical protein
MDPSLLAQLPKSIVMSIRIRIRYITGTFIVISYYYKCCLGFKDADRAEMKVQEKSTQNPN